MTLRTTIDFLLHDWLNTAALSARARFADHSRETFDAVLDTCERIAREKYAPFNRLIDTEEPRFDGEKVILPQATFDANQAYAESGMLSATQGYDVGGMQLPCSVAMAANAFFACASVGMGMGILTSANANLLMTHGSARQKDVFAKNEFSGLWSGTMCLSEPQAGSSLSDIVTRAVPDGEQFASDPLGPRYRLKGNKMWISAGEHELNENIIHLVLAKIPGPDGKLVAGTRGISLFIVPKKMVTPDGALTGVRNDVALAGLNHKLGWRGTTNTLLNFGEGKYPVPAGEGAGSGLDGQGAGAVGYLVGESGKGLQCMFHMMNEVRIGVGIGAAMLGLAGYYASLDYARNRPQGRPIQAPTLRADASSLPPEGVRSTLGRPGGGTGAAGKDATQPQVAIIEHADVKRMLLAQKSYCEGALALELYCAHLVDEEHTALGDAANEARLLLEVLTPIAKSWPSEWCLEANSLAIQVHGGYGYTRDFPVEQYWRDNRLNMIHEGTHGIQAMDLLGRKVLMEEGRGLQLLAARMTTTMARVAGVDALSAHATALGQAVQQVAVTTQKAWATGNPTDALANAVPYMQAFGHTVIAWMWLDVAAAALAADPAQALPATQGRVGATRYFFHYELPKIGAWLAVVASRDATCAKFPAEAF